MITSFFESPLTLFLTGLGLMILFFLYFVTSKERRRRNIGTTLLVGVCGLCLFALVPPKERLKGGIDILGGSSFTLRVQEREPVGGIPQPLSNEQIDQAIAVIEKRLNSMGTADTLIARQGSDRILVQMPGVEPEDSARIRATLEKVAILELREVHFRNDEVGPDGKTLARRAAEGFEIVPGYHAFPLVRPGEEPVPILLHLRPALGGSDIAKAFPSPQETDAVEITLKRDGGDKMTQLTRDMRVGHDRIAIVLDGEVISAPVVQAVPLGRDFSISGLHKPGEVQELANALMNPLENPLIVEAASSVSASFGSSIIKQGVWAGLTGLAITFLLVLSYYRIAGLIARFGLVVNGVILFGVMAMFGFTFTLPGIAGTILTLGIVLMLGGQLTLIHVGAILTVAGYSVNDTIVIFDRIRESLSLRGGTVKGLMNEAINATLSRTLLTSSTTIATVAILLLFGGTALRDFSSTILIGLVIGTYSSVFVASPIVLWVSGRKGGDLREAVAASRPGGIVAIPREAIAKE